MTLTCCQDHILTENIWFEWSETSYSGNKMRLYNARRTNNDDNEQTSEERATQLMDIGGWVSQKVGLKHTYGMYKFCTYRTLPSQNVTLDSNNNSCNDLSFCARGCLVFHHALSFFQAFMFDRL